MKVKNTLGSEFKLVYFYITNANLLMRKRDKQSSESKSTLPRETKD